MFLTIANYLPRLKFFDAIRFFVLMLAGMKFRGRSLVLAPVTVRPIGGARNIEIGKGSFINTGVRFGVPDSQVVIGKNVLVGPRVSFETVGHGLYHVSGVGRGENTEPIYVEDEVWIGAGIIIT